MSVRRRPAFSCPNCAADVPEGAAACPECGADDQTGWSEDTMYDDLDLPDTGWGPEQEPATVGQFPWKAVALIVAAVIVLLILLGLW